MKKLVFLLTAICCLISFNVIGQNKVQKSKVASETIHAKSRTTSDASLSSFGGNLMRLPKPVLPDSDGDGVTDQFDQEQTPPGCPVDSHGVSRDTDGDGVPDCRDKELVTPTVCQPVDADGVGKCPCPEDCGPRMDPGYINALSEMNTLKALNKVQAEELKSLREKLDALTNQVNSFRIAIGKDDMVKSLKAFSMPNPTQQYFTIRTQGSNILPVNIRVLDAMGKLIEERTGLNPNGAAVLGENYRPGNYLVEIVQGSEKAVLKVTKLAN